MYMYMCVHICFISAMTLKYHNYLAIQNDGQEQCMVPMHVIT